MGKQDECGASSSGDLLSGLLPDVGNGVTCTLDAERWAKAEDRTATLIARIQPNQSSEERRRDVANYVQRLIMNCFPCQVFTFGSVPLKTYLPDGDIDVTACSNSEELKETWATVVRDALQQEEKSKNAEFNVKEVQYIQAEVKIIKCLVENIVVDISFNQVGGLCTLCFLEEIDHLISQNHLFKRSIILIKAWCFYESRILGAHHGLISTYALETLVLYIFHVFNNSFSGPLEVLYRFLEFFSNFDWKKFCVSLWGPVPIESLPDMTAKPPRMDGGDLLLSKAFLDACSSVYAVIPGSQDRLGQSFASKHFNVIDPLRTNNNLGRSVSKGNFFRIRSAFAFGAKRLGRLLKCPKDEVDSEIDKFFTNTWERHGIGNRPDAPSSDPAHLLPEKVSPVDGLNRSTTYKKTNETSATQDDPVEDNHGFHDPTSQLLNKLSPDSQNPRPTDSAVSRTQSQKVYGTEARSKLTDQPEGNVSVAAIPQSEKDQKISHSNVPDGRNKFPFGRTMSSPDLTSPSSQVLSRGRRAPKVDYSNKRNIITPEGFVNHSVKSFPDESISSINSTQLAGIRAASDPNSAASNYQEEFGFLASEELPSVSGALEMHLERSQEDQDLANLMAATKLHNYGGQVQVPVHMPSPQVTVIPSPFPASSGHSQRNLSGIAPSNLSLVGAPMVSNMQFIQGIVSPHIAQYVSNPTFGLNTDGGNEPNNENSSAAELDHDDVDRWRDQGSGPDRNINFDRRDNQRQQVSPRGSNFRSFREVAPGAPSHEVLSIPSSQAQPKFDHEDGGRVGEYHADHFQRTGRGSNANSNMWVANSRYPSVPQSSTARNRSHNNMSDESTGRMTRTRDKWGKKSVIPTAPAPLHGKQLSAREHLDSKTEQIPADNDDDNRNLDPAPLHGNLKNDILERPVASGSLMTMQSRIHLEDSDHETAQISLQNQLISIAPVLFGSSQPGAVDNSRLVTFFPTGPPVPIVMVPFIHGNADASTSQFDRNEGIDQVLVNDDGQFESVDQPETSSRSIISSISTEPSDDRVGDILNSDFASHWQNLLFGRYCQNLRNQGPVVYPSIVPPAYLQGHFLWDGPGRPISPGVNLTQVMGYAPRIVPVLPVQPGMERGSGAFQPFGEVAPRHRVGTGTYLPNPKVAFRDRQSSSRNYRGYNNDRSEHGDREGSWANPRQRNAGRSHGRNQADRPNTRPDRLAMEDEPSDRRWHSHRTESFRREPVPPYMAHGNQMHNPNMTYGMLSPIAAGSNGAGPPVLMVYSYDQGGVSYAPSSEPLEFGSLGAVVPEGGSASHYSEEVLPNGFHELLHATYQGGSSRSSPDQPSSPHLRR